MAKQKLEQNCQYINKTQCPNKSNTYQINRTYTQSKSRIKR